MATNTIPKTMLAWQKHAGSSVPVCIIFFLEIDCLSPSNVHIK